MVGSFYLCTGESIIIIIGHQIMRSTSVQASRALQKIHSNHLPEYTSMRLQTYGIRGAMTITAFPSTFQNCQSA
jgi:hypothetical protein